MSKFKFFLENFFDAITFFDRKIFRRFAFWESFVIGVLEIVFEKFPK